MRFSLSALALANAANSESPVISLDLPANKQKAKWATMTSNLPNGGDYAHYKPSDSRNNMGGHYSGPKNSFADECEVKTAEFKQDVYGMPIDVPAVDPGCQEPRAAAFDHHDGDISHRLTTTYTMFVQSNVKSMPTRPGDSLSSPGTEGLSAVDFGQRGEFVINYDVSDSTGNDAEQVEFAMILVDEVAPFFVNSPKYMHSQNVRVYEYDRTHCKSNLDCRAKNTVGQPGVPHNRNIKKYISYMTEKIPDIYGKVAKEQTNVVLELCGDLGSPAIKVGDTVRNLYWQNPEEPITAVDNYDGLLTTSNSPMSMQAKRTPNQGRDDTENGTDGIVEKYEELEYKIDVFEYNGHIDDWFHHDEINKDLGGKVRTISKRDMKYPIDNSDSAQKCLTEMQTGKNAAGTQFWGADQLQINAIKGRDANGNDVDLVPAFNSQEGSAFNCDFKDHMTKFWDESQWAAWKAAGKDVETARDEERLKCVYCVKAYKEYLFDSHDSRNTYMSPLSGLTKVKNGVLDDPQAALGGAAFTSSCWEGVESHQMENQFCGKPLYRQKHFKLEATDFADIFGLNNQNNKVAEDGHIIFQDSIIPTIVLPTSGKWADKTKNGGFNVNAYECGFAITNQEGDQHCTYDAAQSVAPKVCDVESDCLGFDGSDNNRCEKPAYGGKGHCKKIGNTKMVDGTPKCQAADGTFPGSYWTQWLAKSSTSGSWATAYRPNIKYVDCYDSHMKEFNWVTVTDEINAKSVDFDVSSSNWAGVEGKCTKQARTDARLGDAAVGPFVDVLPWRETSTDADHFKEIFGYTGSGAGSLFASCVTKCEADIVRVSGYASGNVGHTGGCTTYCETLAHYDGFECHSKARSIKLSYDVQDNFGNWAKTGTSYISIVDNIAPTLYITTHDYREATHEFEGVKHCDEHHNERLIKTDGTTVCKTGTDGNLVNFDSYSGNDCSTTDGEDFIEGHHLVKEHCDNVRFCKDASGNVHMGEECQGEQLMGQYTMHLDANGQPTKNMSYHKDGNTNQLLDQQIIQHSAGYAGDYRWVEELLMEGTGYECWDLCSSTTTSVEWHSSCADDSTSTGVRFDILTPGTFYLKYDCYDEAGTIMDTDMVEKTRESLHTTACRTFINVDKTKPVLTVFDYANKGDGMYHVEATRDTNYVDAGAACSDMVDGNLNPDVQVSGDVVNMAAVGTYIINYDCEDSAGHRALQAHRTVVVEDTTCPTCSVPDDKPTITVEASFPYSEESSVCTDNIDGYIGVAKVTGTVDIEATGTYVLTYSATDMNNNGYGLDSLSCTLNNVHTTKTIIVEDTMVPIISLKYRNSQLVGSSLMTEASATNAWVIGAIASAISGVALLGYAATRKATVSTTVPV